MPQDPWSAESLGDDRYRFTNISGGQLSMIVLIPNGATEVVVEGGVEDDPHAVPSSVNAGDSFVAVVRGEGVHINATATPSMTPVYWELTVS